MNKTLAVIDAVEQRLVSLVAVAAIAYSAADPSALPPKWAAVIVAVQAVAAKLSPSASAAVAGDPVLDPAPPSDAQVNAELP